MSEQQQFIAMLDRNHVKYTKHESDIDVFEGGITIDIASGRQGIVNSFAHCFCEFVFDSNGNLVNIRFGY